VLSYITVQYVVVLFPYIFSFNEILKTLSDKNTSNFNNGSIMVCTTCEAMKSYSSGQRDFTINFI